VKKEAVTKDTTASVSFSFLDRPSCIVSAFPLACFSLGQLHVLKTGININADQASVVCAAKTRK
jgi:hypothetical protein